MWTLLWKKIKNCRKSLTVWLNGVCLALLPLVDMVRESMPALGQYLTPDALKQLGFTLLVLNIVLRFRTNKSLADK